MFAKLRGYFSEMRGPYGIFLVGLLAHLVVFYGLMFAYGPCVFFLSSDCSVTGNDTQHYVVIADNLSHGNGYSRFIDEPFEPDALRTPLLPLYFVPFAYFGGYELIWLGMIFLNILLSLLGPVVYKLARFFLPHSYALLAGIVVSIEPLYLYRSQIAEPDALLVLILASALYFLVRSWKLGTLRDLFLSALLLGLAILAKPTALYIAALCVVFEVIHLAYFAEHDRPERLKRIIVMFGVVLIVVFPWLARNKIVFGVPELSSIQGYNFYEYYTKDIPIEGDRIPLQLFLYSREPSRYLPLQKDFIQVSIERIKQHPKEFAREYAIGVVRNLFVSDIAAIYYYGHTKILPFPYNPESKINLRLELSRGDFVGFFKGALHEVPKLIWAGILLLGYLTALYGWATAFKRDRFVFFVLFLFAGIFGYLLLSSGPYVEAKYRLPAIPLVLIAALYGLRHMPLDGLKRRLKAWGFAALPFRVK